MSNNNYSGAMATIIYVCIILTISLWEMSHILSPTINKVYFSKFLDIVIVYHLFVNGILVLVLVLIIVASHLKF